MLKEHAPAEPGEQKWNVLDCEAKGEIESEANVRVLWRIAGALTSLPASRTVQQS